MLDKIITGDMTDMSRFSVPGLIVMALGVAVIVFARKLSKGNERRYDLIRIGGLIVVMIGTLVAMKIFG